jgi:hypothetical protein
MPRSAYGANVIPLFDRAIFPTGAPNAGEAGLAIQQVLLWYEPIGVVPPGTLHIFDANDLLKPAWQRRVGAAEDWLAGQIGVTVGQLPGALNRFMRARGGQAHNQRGTAYRCLIAEIIDRWGASGLDVHEEEPASNWFAVAALGQAGRARVDVLVARGGAPRAFVSCKWALRNDRNHDVVNEANAYKSVAAGRGLSVEVGLVTNEFGPARIARVLDSALIDFVAHTNRDLFLAMPWSRSGDFMALQHDARFIDLSGLIARSQNW